jgi:hypothetical protein
MSTSKYSLDNTLRYSIKNLSFCRSDFENPVIGDNTNASYNHPSYVFSRMGANERRIPDRDTAYGIERNIKSRLIDPEFMQQCGENYADQIKFASDELCNACCKAIPNYYQQLALFGAIEFVIKSNENLQDTLGLETYNDIVVNTAVNFFRVACRPSKDSHHLDGYIDQTVTDRVIKWLENEMFSPENKTKIVDTFDEYYKEKEKQIPKFINSWATHDKNVGYRFQQQCRNKAVFSEKIKPFIVAQPA